MKHVSYRERDFAFGQIMLTLRSTLGLTQTELANHLGVSRRAIGEWESGGKYPSSDHLKDFIVLAVEQRAFHAGREDQEIRELWRAARQKVLLDELWLADLLAQLPTATQTELVVPRPAATTTRSRRTDWDNALTVPTFYGREWELAQLAEWVVQDRCRIVSVLGLGGIGKSTLSVRLMHQIADHFDMVIWRSLRDAPSCEALLDECLTVLAPQPVSQTPADLDQRLNLFLEYLRGQRVLVVLDNLETVLNEGDETGHMRSGYEGYDKLLRRVGETEHQSCLLLTSRENPINLAPLEGTRSPVRVLRLLRLETKPCEQLLAEKGVAGTDSELARLIEAYAGNPLALKIVAQAVVDLFDGEVAPFLDQGEIIFGSVRKLLEDQFSRLSPLEQSVLIWLAILREPSTLDDLLAVLVKPVSRGRVLEAIQALYRRSLIERGQQQGTFTLESVVMEYVTTRFITEANTEIQSGSLDQLLEYGIELAQTREYVRQAQTRLIVAPIVTQLRSNYQQRSEVEEHLLAQLAGLREQSGDAQGYGPSNVLAILRWLRGDLRGLDLSGLVLRNVYLQGVEMQDTTLAGASIQSTVFTETFDAVTAVAASSTGDYWATGSRRGEIRLWSASDLTLQKTWHAHADIICALDFSPDGKTLASTGSWDGTVKLWNVASGALLWTAKHPSQAYSLAFAPDGKTLASTGYDAIIRLWDRQTGRQLQELIHPSTVCGVAWSPDGRLLATGDLKGHIRLWGVTEVAVYIRTLEAHTNCAEGLAFSPDNSRLASGSWDGTVKLWDVASGDLQQTLTEYTDRVICVAWSPDGRMVASAGRDQTIKLWDVEQNSYHATLRGHTGGVYALAFTPNSRNLLSGSEDSTLRVWDVASASCTRFLQGHAASLYDVDWSPDGLQLVSGGSDALVSIYSVTNGTLSTLLHGHQGFVIGVSWNSNGRWIASSEWNNVVRIWDALTGSELQVLHYPDEGGDYFDRLAWSPNGKQLAVGTYTHGVQRFEMGVPPLQLDNHNFPTWIRHLAWNPDGSQLAGGGADGAVYVWDGLNAILLKRLPGHFSSVLDLAWSADGKWLASVGRGTDGGDLFIWDVEQGERLLALDGHPTIVYTVVWNASGDQLITGDGDGKLRWWDLQRQECIRTIQGHPARIHSLRRSPDGTTLASCGGAGAIVLWDIETGVRLQTIRRDRPYERLNITDIRGLTEAQKATLRGLGAIET